MIMTIHLKRHTPFHIEYEKLRRPA